MFLRVLSRVPWQASAAVGWAGLVAAPLVAEALEREDPQCAAAHSNILSSSFVDTSIVAKLRTEGFVVGLIFDDFGPAMPCHFPSRDRVQRLVSHASL